MPGAVTAIYDFERPLSHPVSGYTMTSRFVLYDNGVFSLQYPGLAANYLGTYSQENESITFRFGSGTGSTATGTLKDDLLEVRYSLNMQMSDFEDGVYKRAQ